MEGRAVDELITLSRFSGIFSRAVNANDVCRQLVHDSELGHGLIGSQLFSLSDRGLFHQVGTYGIEAFEGGAPLSQFDENPLSSAIEARTLEVMRLPEVSGRQLFIEVLPFTKDEIPVGVLVMVRREPNGTEKFHQLGIKTLSNIGGLYFESLGIRNLFRENVASSDELTERQYEVLLGLARGDTNAEIAKQLILSESSIKQETVRIYKNLGVGTREQAVAKARATGLIPEGVYPPAPRLASAARLQR